jgi:hypothetical protein
LDWVVAWFHSGPVEVGRMAKSQKLIRISGFRYFHEKVWRKHRFPSVIPFSKANTCPQRSLKYGPQRIPSNNASTT